MNRIKKIGIILSFLLMITVGGLYADGIKLDLPGVSPTDLALEAEIRANEISSLTTTYLGLNAQADLDMGVYDIYISSIIAKDSDGLLLLEDGGKGIFIEDGGNVGIGTLNPRSCLEIIGTITIATIAGDNYYTMKRDNSSGFLFFQGYQTGYSGFVFRTDSGEKFRITNSGNIGIGTNNPVTKFEVKNGSITISGTNANLIVGGTSYSNVSFIGGITNYIYIDEEGQLSLNGDATVWCDQIVELTSTKVGSNLKPDFYETNIGFLFPVADETEILYGTLEIPHDYKEESNIIPHVHWEQTSSSTATFKIDYMWVSMGVSTTTFTTIVTTSVVFPYTSGSIHQIASFPEIDGTGQTISSILRFRLYRKADNLPAEDVLTADFDIHYEIDQIGSNDEYVK